MLKVDGETLMVECHHKDAVGFQGNMPNTPTKVVDSVDAMVANQKTSDINQVSIDAVPDFSGLMGKMKDAGKI